MINRPELLAPAGGGEALSAALSAGADAVYFGVHEFNARMGAGNFTLDEAKDAIRLCHFYGRRAYITLNTVVYDRELDSACRTAHELYRAGADAFIVADLGLASALFRMIPEIELHASTQTSSANVYDAEALSRLGFSRMVAPRELSEDNLRYLTKHSPIEIEAFIHGAVCVSFSGQCLMSYMLGGRSGNRGECAQPCRMSYSGSYPLSTKDLCLSSHIRKLMEMGVASFKIEGRMKSAEYVYGVTSVYRKCIGEGRDATAEENRRLEGLFSRSGFTDGYFSKAVRTSPEKMLGVRRENDKSATRDAESKTVIPPIPDVGLDALRCEIKKDVPSSLSYTARGVTVCVTGDVPQEARTQPLTKESVSLRISKLGGTGFCVTDETAAETTVEPNLCMKMSSLNALRRDAAEKLSAALTRTRENVGAFDGVPDVPDGKPHNAHKCRRVGEFASPDLITPKARFYFDVRLLPLDVYSKNAGSANGFVMPPYIFDDETEKVRGMIAEAVSAGAEYALLSGTGQTALLSEYNLTLIAGYRFNVNSTATAGSVLDLGFDFVTISPEMSYRRAQSTAENVPSSLIVYGRIPIMTTERSIIKTLGGGNKDDLALTDRLGVKFPVRGIYGGRTIIYNSVPVYTADTIPENEDLVRHFMFTTESPAEVDTVICAYENHTPPTGGVRRIK